MNEYAYTAEQIAIANSIAAEGARIAALPDRVCYVLNTITGEITAKVCKEFSGSHVTVGVNTATKDGVTYYGTKMIDGYGKHSRIFWTREEAENYRADEAA